MDTFPTFRQETTETTVNVSQPLTHRLMFVSTKLEVSPWQPEACGRSGPCWASRRWPCSCDTARNDSSVSPCRRWAGSRYTCGRMDGVLKASHRIINSRTEPSQSILFDTLRGTRHDDVHNMTIQICKKKKKRKTFK